ncbi:MAG: hypothetical protein ACT4NX_01140 [Deltaproteobacteria bacterium]
MNHKCDEIQDLILDYPEDKLSHSQRLAVKSHVEGGCPRCGALLAESNQMWDLLGGIPEIEPRADFAGRFWDRLAEEEEEQKARGRFQIFDIFKMWKLNFARLGAVAVIFIAAAVSLNVFESERAVVVYTAEDRADEKLLGDMDRAVSRQTADILDIYGPWSIDIEQNNKGG